MPIWMKHPRHGKTPAVGAEVEQNQKNGWVIDEEMNKPKSERASAAKPADVTERSTLSPKPQFKSG